MCFRPTYQAHCRRQYTYPDVLARTPARVQRGNVDARNGEIGNRSYAGIKNARFEEAQDAIETVCSSSSENVMQRSLFMCEDLSAYQR